MTAPVPAPVPRARAATYRVQLHAGFTFDDAAAVTGYLARLGVSHLYCSPILQAAAGSKHGYDVTDHGRLNAELGGAAGYARLAGRLATAGLRQVLDIVPNHMAVGGRASTWWWDVLTYGRSSRYAGYFDIDWDPPQEWLAGAVLVPVLGDRYGRVLDAGELTVASSDGSLVVRYYDHEVPLAPGTAPADEGQAEATREVGAGTEAVNWDPDALDALLQRQHYRLAYWRTAADELNYRRFFDVATLAGLRVEDEEVFEATHGVILGLVRDGTVDGLRIDHVDGLADPAGYLDRLREATADGYVVVEKILQRDEELPDWPVDGTSGYDFLNLVNQLYTDSDGERAMLDCYAVFTGEQHDYHEIEREAKLQVMRDILAAEVERLTVLLARISQGYRRERDFTRPELRETLREVLAAWPVYRGYPRSGQPVTPADAAHAAAAVAEVRRRRPDLDAELAGFIGELAAGSYSGPASSHEGREATFARRFAQVSAPVMAKGVEDTAFYRYHALASLCEVGGDPGCFGRPVAAFHEAMAVAARRWPETMLTLSTHDTKRSGDVRARLSLLAELPGPWKLATERWARRNARHKLGGWPDRNTEYLLYQTLAGAWPIEAARVREFMAKAVKEAKLQTSWTDPDPAYEEALAGFVTAVLADEEFVADLEGFLARHQLVERGRTSSLAQVTLLLTCPGIPDIYQGTEVWDLSLVDPDNRRAVDFGARQRLLDALAEAGPEEALARMDEGGPKFWLIHRLLSHRLRRPQAYGPRSGYQRLEVQGSQSQHVVAFTRTDTRTGAPGLAVVVPRLVARLEGAWDDTTVALPAGAWKDVLTGEDVAGGEVSVAALLRRFPVAVLGRNG